MKKLLTLSAITLLAVSAFGQGQVLFNNLDKTATPNILAPVHMDTLTGALLSGTQARAALLGGPAATGIGSSLANIGNLTMLANPTDGSTWVNFRTGGAAGYVSVGATGARILNNVGYNSSAMLQMVAWTGNFSDWASAYNAAKGGDLTVKIGWSSTWNVTTTTSPTDPAFPRNLGLTEFAVAIVPEPSTLALAGLGAAAMLIFRRRK